MSAGSDDLHRAQGTRCRSREGGQPGKGLEDRDVGVRGKHDDLQPHSPCPVSEAAGEVVLGVTGS